MERPVLEQWVRDVNRLEADLLTLANAPSRRGLDRVQQGLTRVRAPLAAPILIETAKGTYRLQVWHHRLGVIEQLLRHSEAQPAGR